MNKASIKTLRKPDWLRVRLPSKNSFWQTDKLIKNKNLVTVCEEALCPNRWECWTKGSASFMICGEICTRACGFCSVKTARPSALDEGEPLRVALAAQAMQLRHIVITTVARDDLEDGGAEHFAKTIQAVRQISPEMIIETLCSDMEGKSNSLRIVLHARPHVFNHNIETVERLSPKVRSKRANYRQSLKVLACASQEGEKIYQKNDANLPVKLLTKSGLMLGLGETKKEVIQSMRDLRDNGVEAITIGQYLQPNKKLLSVERYWSPQEFDELAAIAKELGFEQIASSPLTRSSYMAEEHFNAANLGVNPTG